MIIPSIKKSRFNDSSSHFEAMAKGKRETISKQLWTDKSYLIL